MTDDQQRARELLADQYPGDAGYETRQMILAGTFGDDETIAAITAALRAAPEYGKLMELAATFETCVPFLPAVGKKNIAKAVAELRGIAARPQGAMAYQPTDGCTEPSCKRCRTHPDHRGEMEHAGIGWRPGQVET